jgi:hypothetical protein
MNPLSAESDGPRTTCWAYRKYDSLVRMIESKVVSKNPKVLQCCADQVAKRIVQRLVDDTTDDFIASLESLLKPDTPYVEFQKKQFVTKGVVVQLSSGDVAISVRRISQELATFARVWLYVLLKVFVSVFKPCPATSSPCTILLEPGGNWQQSDSEFADFCRNGPVTALADATKIIVCAAREPTLRFDARLEYARYPWVHHAESHVTRRDRIALLFACLAAPVVLIRALASCSLTAVLARDIAWLPLVNCLDKKKLVEAVVGTTSSFGSQPLWAKGISNQRFPYHMIWYSQNFVPKLYKGESLMASLPPARHMRVDVHWVWTEGFCEYLRTLGQAGEINIVGPILWYLPQAASSVADTIDVAVFDITPLPEGGQAFGSYKNYYSPVTITKFLLDIVQVCQFLEKKTHKRIRVLLKHKRPPAVGHHDQGYLDFVDSLHIAYPNFSMVPEETNVFRFLAESVVSVSVPYTSTSYVAASLNKHAIYYDPFGELVPVFEADLHVHFAADRESLLNLIEQAIG